MQKWWSHLPNAGRVHIVVAALSLLAGVVLIVLLTNDRVEPGLAGGIAVSLSLVGGLTSAIAGRAMRNRELDDIVRRAHDEDGETGGA